ncbi:hypothetical protein MGN70_009627 [Eutypa lata]|nr:hypothetical protein MGN70_009627 [Eutypa lata]
MVRLQARLQPLLALFLVACLFLQTTEASLGDRLPEFRDCVKICTRENCDTEDPTPIPIHRRLLFWTCPKECDYTCQQIVTTRRRAAGETVTQFHGKWPFTRVLGVQEPFSVLFSLGNLTAHYRGLLKVRRQIPAWYPMRRYYEVFAFVGIATWVFSTMFHTRDFRLTEQLDYFAAGASVLYGLYYVVVRACRLDDARRARRAHLRAWTAACCALYAAHVAYLKLWRWNYTYNMAANVAVGVLQNSIWTWFSYVRWRESRRTWAFLPGCAVTWITMAMGFELLDFPPLWGAIDAHSLWHLGTIVPIMMWYNWMVRDSEDEIAKSKDKVLKA